MFAVLDAARRIYRVRAEPLRVLDEWLTPYRRLWAAQLDALGEGLEAIKHEDERPWGSG